MPGVTSVPGDVEQALADALTAGVTRPADPRAFVDQALRHQVGPLVVRAGAGSLLPEGEAERLRADTRELAVLAALRDRELAAVLSALHAAGAPSLVMKGAHLAHVIYPCTYLRVRADADLLVAEDAVPLAIAALETRGYRRQESAQTHPLLLGQMAFARPDLPGSAIDLHWRISAPRIAAGLFDLPSLVERAVPIPSLGPHARGPSLPDALAIACVHQVAHHPGGGTLLWSYDVHLLLHAMDDLEVDLFVHRAAERGMAGICRHVVRGASARFPSARAVEVIEKLEAAAPAREPSAVLLEDRPPVAGMFEDLSAERGWRRRMRLLAGHLFPPAPYMRETWAPGSRLPLAVLYLQRLWRGTPRWLRLRI